MKFETTDGHMLPAEIGGYKAMESWNSKDKSGAIIGKLADDAAFVFNYHGLSEFDAVALAGKFDWKAIQAAAAAK